MRCLLCSLPPGTTSPLGGGTATGGGGGGINPAAVLIADMVNLTKTVWCMEFILTFD